MGEAIGDVILRQVQPGNVAVAAITIGGGDQQFVEMAVEGAEILLFKPRQVDEAAAQAFGDAIADGARRIGRRNGEPTMGGEHRQVIFDGQVELGAFRLDD